MDISYLHSFCTAVKFKSISEAAKHLHLTQPGLSMQLQSLENEMGMRFLKRSNKGVELTKEGKVLYEYADTVITLSDKLKIDLKNMRNKASNLSICACDSICENDILNTIYKFKEKNKNIDISMDVHTFKEVLKKLTEHETNLAILMKANIPKNLISYPITHDSLILVGPKGAMKENLEITELLTIPVILREESSAILTLLKNELDKNDLTLNDLNVVISLNSPALIKSSVSDGRGYSFFPESAVEHELSTGEFKKIHINDFDIPFDYCIAFRNSYTLTGSEKKLVRFFSTDKKNL